MKRRSLSAVLAVGTGILLYSMVSSRSWAEGTSSPPPPETDYLDWPPSPAPPDTTPPPEVDLSASPCGDDESFVITRTGDTSSSLTVYYSPGVVSSAALQSMGVTSIETSTATSSAIETSIDTSLSTSTSTVATTSVLIPAGETSVSIPLSSLGGSLTLTLLPPPDSSYILGGLPSESFFCGAEAPQPASTIEIDGATGNATATLRIANWEAAFTNDSQDDAGANALRANFENTDARRFYIKVTDNAQRGQATVTASLATTKGAKLVADLADYNQAATNVTLTAQPAGGSVFISPALILVADTVDRANNANQHFLAALGHTVTVRYGAGGAQRTASASVPIDKTVTLNVSVLATDLMGRTPCATQADVTADLKVARERYFQAGILMSWNPTPTGANGNMRVVTYTPRWRLNVANGALNGANVVAIKNPVAAAVPSRFQFFQIQPGVASEALTDMMVDERNLLDQTGVRSAQASVVNIFYVPGLLFTFTDNRVRTFPLNQVADINALLTFRGSAWITGRVPNGYGNTALVRAGETVKFVVPHEAGHLISRDFHSDKKSHLMYGNVGTTDTVTATKRIPQAKQNQMQGNL